MVREGFSMLNNGHWKKGKGYVCLLLRRVVHDASMLRPGGLTTRCAEMTRGASSRKSKAFKGAGESHRLKDLGTELIRSRNHGTEPVCIGRHSLGRL